jgi:hypothetical protein
MKSIIKNILLEEVAKKSMYLKMNDGKFGNAIRRHLEKDVTWGDIDYEMSELAEKYAIPEEYIKFITFKYIVDEGDDPEKEMYLDNWLYKASDPMAFFKDSGYYDKFIDITHFHDIIKTGDDKYVLLIDSWYDLSYLFDDAYIPEAVLSEDWAELYDAWGTSLDEIFNTLNDRGIRIIQDFIIQNVDKIYDIGHREEFNEHGMEITGAVGTDEEGIIDVKSNVENIRQITDNYNLLLLVDEGEFPEKDDLISNLKNAYNNAYNGVAEDELFGQMKSQIEDYLGSEGKWEGDVLHFPVSQQMKDLIDRYVEELHMNPITEHSDYLGMLNHIANQISGYSLSVPDMNYFYPDHSKLETWFNEVLGDYIYL